jgi:hypothetical protein
MSDSTKNLSIEEGTVSFWINPNKVDFSDDSTVPLVNLNPPNGSIFIVKDNDKKIKFFHVFLNHGRTDAEADVSYLDKNIKHMFAFTWSLKEKLTKIYIDGKPVAKSLIKYANSEKAIV